MPPCGEAARTGLVEKAVAENARSEQISVLDILLDFINSPDWMECDDQPGFFSCGWCRSMLMRRREIVSCDL
ncbi:hypothetical protein DO70_5257 [Burkholderia pseudomallei]|nr:hypothetical protein DO70_5257 [Burkholderia pseudomallei]